MNKSRNWETAMGMHGYVGSPAQREEKAAQRAAPKIRSALSTKAAKKAEQLAHTIREIANGEYDARDGTLRQWETVLHNARADLDFWLDRMATDRRFTQGDRK